MQKIALLNVVGLSQDLLNQGMPFLKQWSQSKALSYIQPPLPAVTCTSQSCFLTGKWPNDHGIVANGWYFKDLCEIKFWHQSNKLLTANNVWDKARHLDPTFRVNNLFWWYNMYSSADVSVTPRPMYLADGRKIPDCYSKPEHLRYDLQKELGQFPLFNFWGPMTSIAATRWIADAAKIVEMKYPAALNLVYLPHLDYNLQRLGPNDPKILLDLTALDELCWDLIAFYEARQIKVILVSEYGISSVNHNIPINQILRKHGYISVREELGREILDPGASRAFAVADHQIAHIYINDHASYSAVYDLLAAQPHIKMILDQKAKAQHHLDHPRSGELIAVSDSNAWFNYYYWLDDRKAPDFARTVDIHRKPGYDPVELFLDPNKSLIKAQIIWKLMKKKLGFRQLMDVIPLNPELVKGSHGAPPQSLQEYPVIINHDVNADKISAVDVHDIILNLLGVQSNNYSHFKSSATASNPA